MRPDLEARMNDVGAFIREQRRVAAMSVRKLSELAGISNPYLSQIERGLRNPSAEILQQLAKALRISAETLYLRAGILDGEPVTQVQMAIECAPELTPEQRQTLLRIYESFVSERRRDVPSTPKATG